MNNQNENKVWRRFIVTERLNGLGLTVMNHGATYNLESDRNYYSVIELGALTEARAEIDRLQNEYKKCDGCGYTWMSGDKVDDIFKEEFVKKLTEENARLKEWASKAGVWTIGEKEKLTEKLRVADKENVRLRIIINEINQTNPGVLAVTLAKLESDK